jgi:hypothetical protein
MNSDTSAGMQPAAPKPGGLFTTRNIIIGLVALVFLCVCACGGVAVLGGGTFAAIFSQIAPGATVGGEFMGHLQAGNWDKAYALCGPALQKELGSADALGRRVTNGKSQPTGFVPSNTNVNNDRLEMSGSATFIDGRSGTFELIIDKIGNDWKIVGFNLQPKQ